MKRLSILVVLGACGSSTTAPPDVANGTLGEWKDGPALPVPRANHCSAALRVGDQDWIVVVGGNAKVGDGFAATDEIDAAPLAADGTLGAWVVAGHTPSAVTECTAAADGATLYLIDGLYETESDRGHVLAATLDASGTLGGLTAMGDLPAGVVTISSEAAVRDGALYVMHSELPADGDATLTLHTPLDAFGWDMADWGIGFRAQAQYAFTKENIFAIGGYGGDDNAVLTDVIMATLDGGVVLPSPSLPAPVAFGEAAAVDDYLFVVGGRGSVFGAGGSTTVYVSAIGGDWSTSTALPVPRTNHDLVLAGDYLVLTGGADTAGGDTAVLVAQVRFPQ